MKSAVRGQQYGLRGNCRRSYVPLDALLSPLCRGLCSSLANSPALKRRDLRKALLQKSAKFAFFGSGLAPLPELEKFNSVSLTDRHRIVQMSPITTCPAEASQGKPSAKVKSLAYFGQFMGPARDRQWGTWLLAYCGLERPENLDVLVLLREPHAKWLQDLNLKLSTLRLCSAAVSLRLRSPDLASRME
jgi:hypothetical protein